MQIFEKLVLMQQACKHAARPLVFVPTMGALHEGHASLLRRARLLAGESGTVAVSIFINPRQFHVAQDLELYPRPFAADQALCEEIGTNFLFHPRVEEIYLREASLTVHENQLSRGLCGASRPGHFEGVATVLTKLFNIVAPDQVILGEKDWQQLAIVRRLVGDFNFPIEVISHLTVREQDGLAMSSRNVRLSPMERGVAPKIYEALAQARALVLEGGCDVQTLLTSTRATLALIPNATIDYVEIVDENTLQPLKKIVSGTTPARLLVAVKIGETRLIDNVGLSFV